MEWLREVSVEQAGTQPGLAEEIGKQADYFETNTHRMRYPEFREKGSFVGSGVIEAGCKSIVGGPPQAIRHVLDRKRCQRHHRSTLLPVQSEVQHFWQMGRLIPSALTSMARNRAQRESKPAGCGQPHRFEDGTRKSSGHAKFASHHNPSRLCPTQPTCAMAW